MARRRTTGARRQGAKSSGDSIPLAWLAGLGVLGAMLLGRKPAGAEYGPTSVPLVAGTSYLFVVRLDAHEDAARAVVESKGAENVQITEASNPPFWASPDVPFSTRVISFKAAPQGSSIVLLGDPFYGIGRLERVIRL